MMSLKKLNVIVDNASSGETDEIKHARMDLRGLVQNQGQRILQIERETLAKDINRHIQELVQAVETIDISNSAYHLDSVSFTLAVTSTGEIALFSAIKGSASPHMGIAFTLKPTVRVRKSDEPR